VALLLRFNVPLLMIAASMIFVLGYFALFVSLLTFLAITKGLYEGAKRVQAYALRSALENGLISSDAETPSPREKRFVVPALTLGVGEASVGVSSH
jgi:hypothetical protein